MNRTIKYGDSKAPQDHQQLKAHLTDCMAAYNYAFRLKALNELTLYEYIRKIWTSEPQRSILNSIGHMPKLNK